jgi:hypothetical protein
MSRSFACVLRRDRVDLMAGIPARGAVLGTARRPTGVCQCQREGLHRTCVAEPYRCAPALRAQRHEASRVSAAAARNPRGAPARSRDQVPAIDMATMQGASQHVATPQGGLRATCTRRSFPTSAVGDCAMARQSPEQADDDDVTYAHVAVE